MLRLLYNILLWNMVFGVTSAPNSFKSSNSGFFDAIFLITDRIKMIVLYFFWVDVRHIFIRILGYCVIEGSVLDKLYKRQTS